VHLVGFYYKNESEYCQTQNSVTIPLHGCVGRGRQMTSAFTTIGYLQRTQKCIFGKRRDKLQSAKNHYSEPAVGEITEH